MRSINRLPSPQVQTLLDSRAARIYFGTNGSDIIEYALSLDFILSELLNYVRTHGEDVAVWMREEGEVPRLIAFVKPLVNSSAAVKMI